MRLNKNAIVLLITLMFILAISGLILKNLDDSNAYIDASNHDDYYVKSLISVDNLKNEFLQYFVKNMNEVDTLLEEEKFKEGLTLEYGDINAFMMFEKYEERYNINTLNNTDETSKEKIEELFNTNNVAEFELFRALVKSYTSKYKSIVSFAQIETIIDDFINKTEQTTILEIKDKFTFLDISEGTFILCNMLIKHSDSSVSSEFIYDLKNKKIEGFDIAFK